MYELDKAVQVLRRDLMLLSVRLDDAVMFLSSLTVSFC